MTSDELYLNSEIPISQLLSNKEVKHNVGHSSYKDALRLQV